ncbi:hypothetical protein GCM10009850_035000 [Nonomuraea monospora]|uniref:DUF4440 domain-containing protein n=1 Tax=Nonomuraea monospora TaxID=568818 RepID=A0ABN3CF67_9ACTN
MTIGHAFVNGRIRPMSAKDIMLSAARAVSEHRPMQNQPGQREALVKVVRSLIAAENLCDREAAAELLSPHFAGIVRANGLSQSREELLDRISAPTDPAVRRRLDDNAIEVQEAPGWCVVHSIVITDGAAAGRFRNTHLLVQEEDVWRCLFWQVTELRTISRPFFVLLARHGQHSQHILTRSDPARDDSPHPSEIVGEVLREQLLWQPPLAEQPDDRITIAEALYAPSPEARTTMAILGNALGSVTAAITHPSSPGKVHRIAGDELDSFLAWEDPSLHASRGLAGHSQHALAARVREAAMNPAFPERNAVLIVGHQPQLSRLADAMARDPGCPGHRRWRRLRVPIAHGEVICLVFADRYGAWPFYRPPRVLWSVAPADNAVMTDLKEKIKSKLDTAKLLGTAITFILGAMLALLTDTNRWGALESAEQLLAQVAAGLLLASFVLYLATLYAYDRLTMPPRFWTELSPRQGPRLRRGRRLVSRPPSSAVWVLYQNMQRVWWGLFTPATVGFGLALALMAVILTPGNQASATYVALASLGGLGAAVVAVLCVWFRPVLGSDD